MLYSRCAIAIDCDTYTQQHEPHEESASHLSLLKSATIPVLVKLTTIVADASSGRGFKGKQKK